MITVEANQKLVKVDVASSQKSISSEKIAEMPVVVFQRWLGSRLVFLDCLFAGVVLMRHSLW